MYDEQRDAPDLKLITYELSYPKSQSLIYKN